MAARDRFDDQAKANCQLLWNGRSNDTICDQLAADLRAAHAAGVAEGLALGAQQLSDEIRPFVRQLDALAARGGRWTGPATGEGG